jgi:hypothetical protein
MDELHVSLYKQYLKYYIFIVRILRGLSMVVWSIIFTERLNTEDYQCHSRSCWFVILTIIFDNTWKKSLKITKE